MPGPNATRVGRVKRKFCKEYAPALFGQAGRHYSEGEITCVWSLMSIWFLIIVEWLMVIVGTVLAEYALQRRIRS